MKKIFCLLLSSFMMINCFSPLQIYADDTEIIEEAQEEDNNINDDEKDETSQEEPQNDIEEPSTEESMDDEDDVSEEIEQSTSDIEDGDMSILEYVYVQNVKIELDETETIVVSLNDSVDSIYITIEWNGNVEKVSCTNQTSNLYEFTKNYAQTGSYSIQQVIYEKDDVRYRLILSDAGIDAKFGVNQEYDGYDEDEGLYIDLEEDTETVSEDVDFAVAEIEGDSESEAIEEITNAIENSQENVNPTTLMSTISDTIFTKAYAESNMTICLDPGHGGSDCGASNDTYGAYERDINYKIATYLKSDLEQYNVNVIMTHTIDENPSLYERCKYAYDNGASVVISIHLN